ncbi:hypothetical protein LCGC14_0979550 [marine sediment metagenome]|uniref:Uncharacterized protein n=1 Tax=marine sediment metagenome TaxID=412755 RepID=A0A0F9QSG3_9ZZZZ
MGVATVTTWTCDGCGAKECFESGRGDMPFGWILIILRRPIKPESYSSHRLELCMDCQGRMLDSLEQSPPH